MNPNLEKSLDQRLKQELPPPLSQAIPALGRMGEKLGLRVFLVGGFVRDLLLHRQILDIDIAVEGREGAARLALGFSRQEKILVQGYPHFGTATLHLPGNYRIDLATTRKETYPAPAALPRVRPGNIHEDLYRRDFTINSLALCLHPSEFGKMLDPFGGCLDLKRRRLRVLHPRSFSDDPTRIFRALRFEQRLGFRLAPDNLLLIRKALAANAISRLSGTRLLAEIKFSLSLPETAPLLARMGRLRILAGIDPSLKFGPETARVTRSLQKSLQWFGTAAGAGNFPGFEPWVANLIALTANLPEKKLEHFVARLAPSAKVRKKIAWDRTRGKMAREMLEANPRMKKSLIFSQLHQFPPEAILFLEAQTQKEPARKALRFFLHGQAFTKPETDGQDLKRLGIPPGPLYREILARLRDLKMNGETRTKKQELEWVRKQYGPHLRNHH
ncbi:MAG: hypothetical protein NT056_03160 [Proteobacteria bacterium]|nr:hypothetical protein [Pseudomonadota bacterium]